MFLHTIFESLKKKIHNERGAGRKPKYGEKTVVIRRRVPVSKEEEIKKKIDEILKSYQTKKSHS